MRILVVDDDDTLRLTVRSTLETRGYTVVEAEDGEEAVKKVILIQNAIYTLNDLHFNFND